MVYTPKQQRKVYKVPVKYIFTGTFDIVAETQQQAQEYAERHCGMTADGGIHSSLPSDDIGRDFLHHPEKKIGKAKRIQ